MGWGPFFSSDRFAFNYGATFTMRLDLIDTFFRNSRRLSAVVHLSELILISTTCGSTTVTRGRNEALIIHYLDYLVFLEFSFGEVDLRR